jgi:hypothetical protein
VEVSIILIKQFQNKKFNNMGYIKEPKGVDFVVDPRPLTKKEEQEISDNIAKQKLANNVSTFSTKPLKSKSKILVK